MKRRQRVKRTLCPGCGRDVSYSLGVGELAEVAHLRRHRRQDPPAGEWCETTLIGRERLQPVIP